MEPLRRVGLALLAVCAAGAGRLDAQDPGTERAGRLRVLVDHVAGSTFYITAGTDAGLEEGQILTAYADSLDTEGHAIRLLGVSRSRALATYEGAAFPVTRGDALYLARRTAARAGGAAGPVAGPGTGGAPAPAGADPEGEPFSMRGRLLVDMSWLQSVTNVGVSGVPDVRRSFAAPSLRLATTMAGLPGGATFDLNMSATRRYDSNDAIDQPTAVRVYEARLSRSFDGAPVDVTAGRFYSPYERYSGFWDGLLVHYGRGGLGGSVALGFEPDYWNEGVSLATPKVSAVLDYRGAAMGPLRYDADVSVHYAHPTDAPGHSYAGWSQRLGVGRLVLAHDLEVDRDGGGWTVGRFDARASTALTSWLRLNALYSTYRPYRDWVPDAPLGYRRDRFGGGVGVSGYPGSAGFTVTWNRPDSLQASRTYSGYVALRELPRLRLRAGGSATYWTDGDDGTLLLAPTLRRPLGAGTVRAEYRYYRSRLAGLDLRTQTAVLGADLPLPGGLRASVLGSRQWGGGLTGTRLFTSLWLLF